MTEELTFKIEPALLSFMEKKNYHYILVESITSESSDFEITELHVHCIPDKRAQQFLSGKDYCDYPVSGVHVLFPTYKMDHDSEICFSLKKLLCFTYIGYTGIRKQL